MGGKGVLDLAPDCLPSCVVGSLLINQPAGGAHDASVLGLLLRGRGEDIWRLAVHFDCLEPGAAEEGAYVIRVGECHGTGSAGRFRRGRTEMAQRHLVRDEPVAIGLERSPAGKAQPTSGPRRSQQIGESRPRIGKEHDAKPRGDQVEAIGLESIAANARLAPARVSKLLDEITRDTERLPQSADEIALDQALVCAAVHQAVARHCGTIATVYTATGPVTVQYGKDLSSVAAVVGTGGALVHSGDPYAVLKMTLASSAEPMSLRPRKPTFLLDREYLLYACGLLASVEPQAALELALAHLEPINSETHHERTRTA